MPDQTGDKLDQVLNILRDQGASIGAIAFCRQLFGHARIEKLSNEERDELTILIRKRILEASMSTGERVTPHVYHRPLQ